MALSLSAVYAAETSTVCGQAPVVTDDSVAIAIQSAAKAVEGQAARPSFTTTLTQAKHDIFARYASGQRAIAYYQYVVCQIIMQDAQLSTEERLAALNKAFSVLFVQSAPAYDVYAFLVLNTYDGVPTVEKSELRRAGTEWVEVQRGKVVFHFRELQRTAEHLYLVDDSRHMEIRIPVQGGVSEIRFTGEPSWRRWNEMHPPQKS
jgi:hypothetical protein